MRKVLLLCFMMCSWGVATAADNNNLPRLTAGDLRNVVAPVALYPDDLLGVVLPAATRPLQVVQARQRLKDGDGPDANWDPAIIALMNYPEVVDFLYEDIEWMETLGIAFASQEADLFAAVQNFRADALAAGNLKSDQYQVVRVDGGDIRIESRGADEIYVPYYEPEQVVVRVAQPVYHYYPVARPVYYYPYPVRHRFYDRPYYGVNTYFTIGWQKRGLGLFYTHQSGHPYARHNFSTNIYFYDSKSRYGHGHHYRAKHRPAHYKRPYKYKRHYKTHRKAHYSKPYRKRHSSKRHYEERGRKEHRRKEHRRAAQHYSPRHERNAKRHDKRRMHGVKQYNSRRDYARDQRQIAKRQNAVRNEARKTARHTAKRVAKREARNTKRAARNEARRAAKHVARREARQTSRRVTTREVRREHRRADRRNQQRFSGNRQAREKRR